jgi:alpha-ketoglutarate-dependent taurine dioxygenase
MTPLTSVQDTIDELARDALRHIVLLKQLLAYAHASRSKDLMIWDNRGLMHTATPYDFQNDRRLIYRIVTVEECL